MARQYPARPEVLLPEWYRWIRRAPGNWVRSVRNVWPELLLPDLRLDRLQLLAGFGPAALGGQLPVAAEVVADALQADIGRDARRGHGGAGSGGGGVRDCRSGRRAPRFPSGGELRQRFVVSIRVDQPVTDRQHDLLQLRHAALGGLNVDRVDVQERVAHRQHQDLAAQHVRALLVPQRQVLGYVLVLVDVRGDVHRSRNQLLLGKEQHREIAQMLAVAAAGHEADQVVLISRRERDQEQEFRLAAAGQG